MIKWLNNWGWFIVGLIGYAITFTGAGFAFTNNKDITLKLLLIGGLLAFLGMLFNKPNKKNKNEIK